MGKDKNIVQVGVASWIFNPDEEVLLGRRIGSHGAMTWAPPGGHMEFGESPIETVLRETAEETGIILLPLDIHIVGITNDVFDLENRHYVTIHCVTGLDFGANPKIMEPKKCAEWRWFGLSQMPQNMFLPAAKFVKYVIANTK